MRPAPPSSPPAVSRRTPWSTEVELVLVTRLFGGGARPRQIDEVTWLRPAAAKSALRGWWRIGQAHRFGSLSELRGREQALFGAPATFDANGAVRGGPGALEVEVRAERLGQVADYAGHPGSPLNVALFPAAPMNRPAAALGLPSDRSPATVRLTTASDATDIREELLESLRLWATLGGAGARTRRGVGALAVATPEAARRLGVATTLRELEAFLRQRCVRRPVAPELAAVFCLARTRTVFIGRPCATGEEAQEALLRCLQEARQDRPRPPRNTWGRSRWPEADAIRLKFDPSRPWSHRPDPANAGHYPRAALGLPIQVHFKDERDRRTEPPDHQILAAVPARPWAKLERYASPILLRPVRVWEGRQARHVPVAIFTDCTLPTAARPLVTANWQEPLNAGDVVTAYDIRATADATLSRVEAVFARDPSFRKAL